MQQLTQEYGLVSPKFDQDPNSVSLAKRIESFDGLRLGLLDNRKDNVDHLLQGFADEFSERYDIQDVTMLKKFIFSMPAEDTEIATLVERSDFVITAIAD